MSIPNSTQKKIDRGSNGFSRGMLCPECGIPFTCTIDSRPSLSYIRRRWVCENGHRFTTREEVVPEGQWIPDFQI